ncbi:MAG: hypothetical protein J1E83_09185 [Lachnospiraceae bacterium]|nr:hypothetical protein [Lachnospiraceae bacterium]
MNRMAWKRSLIVCRMEYGRWLTDHKVVLILLPMVFLKSTVIDGFYSMSRDMGANYNLLEPFIAAWNQVALSLLLICFYLLLIGDYMKGSGILKHVFYFAGRKNWIRGQLLFLILSSGSYLFFWLLLSVLISVPHGFIGNTWSNVVTDYVFRFPYKAASLEAQLIEGNLFRQLSPLAGLLHTFLLNWLYLILLGELVALCFVLHIRKFGIAVAVLVVGAGTGASLVAEKIKWFFPAAHAGLAQHFTEYFREEIFSLKGSYIAGVITVVVLAVLICHLAKRIRFSDMEDEKNV